MVNLPANGKIKGVQMADNSPNWLDVAHIILLSRKMDLLEVQQLTPQGKVKYQFSAVGHELAQVLVAQALTHPHDGPPYITVPGRLCLPVV